MLGKFAHVGVTVGTATALLVPVGSAAAADDKPQIICSDGRSATMGDLYTVKVRPDSCDLDLVDSTALWGVLKGTWSTWGKDKAVGRGRLVGHIPAVKGKFKVTLSRPVSSWIYVEGERKVTGRFFSVLRFRTDGARFKINLHTGAR